MLLNIHTFLHDNITSEQNTFQLINIIQLIYFKTRCGRQTTNSQPYSCHFIAYYTVALWRQGVIAIQSITPRNPGGNRFYQIFDDGPNFQGISSSMTSSTSGEFIKLFSSHLPPSSSTLNFSVQNYFSERLMIKRCQKDSLLTMTDELV